MISRLTGVLESYSENTFIINVGGISYEVFIPTAIIKSFDGMLQKNAKVSLITYHYHQTDPSKSIPILIGFSNHIEKDFFEKFITVSGVGPKAAVKALSMPIPDIAQAIDSGDLDFLKSLPGIGGQRAKEIIAKLQGKMGKFSLMQSSDGEGPAGATQGASAGKAGAASAFAQTNVRDEALDVLLQLQYKKDEAKEMIRKAFSRKQTISSAEDLLNEVYRQTKDK